jgi:hypothetical protein
MGSIAMKLNVSRLAVLFACAWLGSAIIAQAQTLSPTECAAQANELLSHELASLAGEPGTDSSDARAIAGPANDATFLKRAYLDLIGELPTPEEVTEFSFDPSADKRDRLVVRLLADERFGANWGRYWRDVILYRRSDDRALLASAALESYLTGHFNQGTSWDKIAQSFITATGDVRENGETAIFIGQMGETAETTAEVARIFLGIQIQCAQCHDHPTDRWKREQFHELAAFFPRVEIRPVARGTGQRSFELVSVDRDRPGRRPGNIRRAESEHRMPDLNDPTAEGTVMTPTFFLTGRQIDLGTPDLERRTLLANWITGERDPWFARAFVNRMWSELVGEGFYEPVDDMGPDRACSAPETLDLLATQFRANGFDVKWLFRTIASTEAYQRESRSRREADELPFAANCSQRLRADQLYNSLTTALGVSTLGGGGRGRRGGGPRYGMGAPRSIFSFAFGFDPSEPREEIAMSIPQALALMNSPTINRSINAHDTGTALGGMLADGATDKAIIVELYLRCLAREPNPNELETCLDHVGQTPDRAEALEDIQWALINSTEFLHRK